MEKFTDMTPSKWDQIDFTKVIAGESPFVSWINNRPYPALRKYQIKTIVSVDKAIIVAGSNSEELMDERIPGNIQSSLVLVLGLGFCNGESMRNTTGKGKQGFVQFSFATFHFISVHPSSRMFVFVRC